MRSRSGPGAAGSRCSTRPAMGRSATPPCSSASSRREAPSAGGEPTRRARRLSVALLALLPLLVPLIVACGAPAPSPSPQATPAELARWRARRGALERSETTAIGRRSAYREYRVRLVSTSGLVATGRLLRPATGAGPFPGVLLDDGRELNSRVLDYLPADFGSVVVLALDYPAEIPYTLDLGVALRRSRELHEALRRIPALFSLGSTYLAQRTDVDSQRVAIVATSFAVPFAVIAAAINDHIRNVGLVYGAADFPQVLAANLTLRPRALRLPVARFLTRPLADLEPTRFVAQISPRPLVMVNGIDDPQMPREAVEALYRAARTPKALIWMRTGHLMPDDSALIRALVDTAMDRLPVLHGVGAREPGGRRARSAP